MTADETGQVAQTGEVGPLVEREARAYREARRRLRDESDPDVLDALERGDSSDPYDQHDLHLAEVILTARAHQPTPPVHTGFCWCANRSDGRRHEFMPGRGVGLCGVQPTPPAQAEAVAALRSAVEMEPAEAIALTVAWAQVERGEEPSPNVASVCVLVLERIRRAALTPDQETDR